jgi:hypothetical protein
MLSHWRTARNVASCLDEAQQPRRAAQSSAGLRQDLMVNAGYHALRMLLAWVLLVVGLVGATFVSANARQLAARPRRGTEWRPSYRAYLLTAGAFLLIAVGSLLNILGS